MAIILNLYLQGLDIRVLSPTHPSLVTAMDSLRNATPRGSVVKTHEGVFD
jgi:hypothetical protein